MLYVHFTVMHAFSEVSKRKTGDWFTAKKLLFDEEKRVVYLTKTEKKHRTLCVLEEWLT